VALTATIHTFDVDLSDVDRGVYETFELRAARHPSESEEYLVTRVLAYCLEYAEGLAFTKGLAEPDEPAIVLRDLTGAIRTWIDVGAPGAAKLHKAGKAAARVAVYTHKDPDRLRRDWSGERIHRLAELELYAVDPALVSALVARLARRSTLAISVTSGHVYATVGDEVIEGSVSRHAVV
jgi:uncharacterized protein YaeQ